jgi:hypothetical protein
MRAPASQPPLPAASRTAPLLAAIAMTLLNAIEPLCVDDVCHWYFAQQVAADPLHPFACRIPWHQEARYAFDVMVPPVFSYFWAPAVALAKDSPLVWKLWLLPLHLLLCVALAGLFRRFAPGREVPLLWLSALGPALLPGLNLMLEGPMLAFGLAGLVQLVRSVDGGSTRRAALGGVLLGLALQTKYSALALLGPFVLYALLRRRIAPLAAALGAAFATFAAIELFLAVSSGRGSYFLHHLGRVPAKHYVAHVSALVLHTAGLAAPVALLGLVALRAPRWLLATAAAAFATGHVALAFVGAPAPGTLRRDTVVWLAMAAVTWGVALAVAGRLALAALRRLRMGARGRDATTPLFLLGWLLAEALAAVALPPFPAARRVLPLVLVLCCAAGWLAARTVRRDRVTRWIAAAGALLGIGYQAVDVLEADAARSAAVAAAAVVRERDPGARVWFSGGWGFEFHAARAGMQPLLRDVDLAAGDFVVVGSVDGEEQPWFAVDPARLRLERELAFGDAVPWTTTINYYSGQRPLEPQNGPRFVVRVFRAAEAHLPVPREARAPSDSRR